MDDGIGIFLLNELKKRNTGRPDLEWVDAGTFSFSVIHYISKREKAVFLDCAFMGCKPGTIRRFLFDDIKTKKEISSLSFHDSDLLKTLALAKNTGSLPVQTVIFGIQPEKVDYGEGLSPSLRSRISLYLREICAELGLHYS